MVKEFVPEMRSDKKDAEIARLRVALEKIAEMDAHDSYYNGGYETTGYALAARVLQSDLYAKLDERERAECDHFIAVGQGRALDQQEGAVAVVRHYPINGKTVCQVELISPQTDGTKLYTHHQSDTKLAEKPVERWNHGCDVMAMNVWLWVKNCPKCGMPHDAPEAVKITANMKECEAAAALGGGK